jgi:mono/diheme cytochrome c family protein
LYEAVCATCHGPDGRGMPQSHLGFDLEIPAFTDCAFATPESDAGWFRSGEEPRGLRCAGAAALRALLHLDGVGIERGAATVAAEVR